MYFVLHLKMIGLLVTGFYLELSDCAEKGMPIYYFRVKDSFPVTGFWILLGYCFSISRDLRNEI